MKYQIITDSNEIYYKNSGLDINRFINRIHEVNVISVYQCYDICRTKYLLTRHIKEIKMVE